MAEAQPTGRVYRIGVLVYSSRADPDTAKVLRRFEQGLRELGYIEGRNLIFEWREADGRKERLPALAADLVARKVDLIVASATDPALAAKSATDSIPIVFVHARDPVGLGLVKTLARPGNNVTGFSSFSDEIIGKQLELLRELYPRIRRLGVLLSADSPSNIPMVAAMRKASAALKLEVRLHEVNAEADLEGTFRAIEKERPDALQVFFDVITYRNRKRIADFAAAQRLPAVYGLLQYVEAGGLMSYSFSSADNFGWAAAYVDKILKGARPADLPVQQPMKLELAINRTTAKALGLTIPPSVLLRAEHVIE
jgi:putative ABC transport system substrate-binding protein